MNWQHILIGVGRRPEDKKMSQLNFILLACNRSCVVTLDVAGPDHRHVLIKHTFRGRTTMIKRVHFFYYSSIDQFFHE